MRLTRVYYILNTKTGKFEDTSNITSLYDIIFKLFPSIALKEAYQGTQFDIYRLGYKDENGRIWQRAILGIYKIDNYAIKKIYLYQTKDKAQKAITEDVTCLGNLLEEVPIITDLNNEKLDEKLKELYAIFLNKEMSNKNRNKLKKAIMLLRTI